MKRLLILAGTGAVLVLAAAGAGYLYFFSGLRSAPPPLALASPSPAAAEATAQPTAGGLEGKWSIASGSQAGYRVSEQFVEQTSPHEAVARSSEVSGGFTLQASGADLKATGISFSVGLGSLQSVDSVAGHNVTQRDGLVQRALDVSRYPTATFTAADLVLTSSQTSAKIPGSLTIHGVTKQVEFDVQGQVQGSQISLAGSTSIDVRDYGVQPPQAPFVTPSPQAKIEFSIVLKKG